MKDIKNICKIALVQAEPVMFNKSASLKKALQCINEAAIQKPDIISLKPGETFECKFTVEFF